MNIIENALQNKQQALSEFQSKQYLRQKGIPVTREVLTQNTEEAVAAAETIGYPVALKACSPVLLHKSDQGCLELKLSTAAQVTAAFNRIQEQAGILLDGILVQEMVVGTRELVVGLSRDPQFGAYVMLGLGGVMTEILQDTAFRVAPFDPIEAADMIHDLSSEKILDAFRGQQPADRERLCEILTTIGSIGLTEPSIAEIDINPLIVTPEGQIKAVDALIILESESPS